MLILQIGCLIFTLLVLQKYIKWKINVESHRLLPLVLAVVVIYDFYETVALISGERELFLKLEELLLAQMLYLMFCYIKEFCKIRIHNIVSSILFVMLLLENIAVFVLFDNWMAYRSIFLGILILYSILYICLGAYSFFVYSMSKREYFVDCMLFIALVIPCITIHVAWFENEWAKIILSISLCVSCGIILYLMYSGKLEDTEILIKKDIYDTSDAGTILFDADMYYLDSNKKAKEFFEELSEKDGKREWRNRNQDINLRNKIAKLLQTDKENTIVEWKNSFYQCSVIPVIFKDAVKGYVVNIFDVTYQNKEMNRIEELAATKNRFFAAISHDLRTPIHAIMGIADIILSEKRLSVKNRSLLIQQKNAGNMLLDQINSILLFSKIEAGKLVLEEDEYDFENMVKELANICVVNLQSKPVDFRVSFINNHPGIVIGDRKRVYEMIQNLLSNSMKFTEQGEISCLVDCEEEEERVLFRVTVKDTGIGMSREQIKSAFSEYVSYAGDSCKEGFGLGLSIVRQLTEMMGGEVFAESDGKSGTTVYLSFYQRICNEDKRPPVLLSKNELTHRTFSNSSVREKEYIYPEAEILVVDDMKTNLDIFMGFIEPLKIKADTAGSGQEAIELVKNNSYDMIFIDKMMPGLNGVETADIIAAISETPLVLVTADVTVNKENIVSKHNFIDVLRKPVNLNELDRLIYKYMPVKYRVLNTDINELSSIDNKMGTGQIYIRTLRTYLNELKEIEAHLSEWNKGDMLMFRTKVHGIKGVSKQLGRFEIGESAEILEMAAKTENYSYIDDHLEDFLAEVRDNIKFVEAEISGYDNEENEESYVNLPAGDKKESWKRLKNGFENYDISVIEHEIKVLKNSKPDTEEKMLLDELARLCDDFEYEEGIRLINRIIERNNIV